MSNKTSIKRLLLYLLSSNKNNITMMDFLRVTLIEKLESGMRVADMKRQSEYLLPLSAIKSISRNLIKENVWNISICNNYIPDTDFKVGHAELEMVNPPFRILN